MPEFILNENGQHWIGDIDKSAGVVARIPWQIKNIVGLLIILSYFISGRRKECEQDFKRWVLAFKGFNNRPCLLKFTE